MRQSLSELLLKISGSKSCCLIIIIAFWAILVLPGIHHGLPQLLDPDELIFVRGALSMLGPPYLDPSWYGAPASTLMDALAPLYWIYLLIASSLHSESLANFTIQQHMTELVLIGRFVTALSMLFAAIVAFDSTRRLLRPIGALAASIALLSAPGLVHYSQITRMDILMIFFLLLTLRFSTAIISDPSIRNFVMSGIFLGAATVSKYPGAMGAFSIAFSAMLSLSSGRANLSRIANLVTIAALCSIFTAFILAPYIFINFPQVLSDVTFEARDKHLSANSQGFLDSIQFYLFSGIPEISGYPIWIAGLAGYCFHLFQNPRSPLSVYGVFSICFLIFIASLSLQWARWGLPLAAVAAIGVGALISELDELLKSRGRRHVLALSTAFAIVFVPSLVLSAKMTFLKAFDHDTRVLALKWVQKNVSSHERIALESYAPQLPVEDYGLLIPSNGKLLSIEQAWPGLRRPPPFFGSFGGQGFELQASDPPDVVILSGWEDRFRAERHIYPDQLNVYEDIRRNFTPVREFSPGYFVLGPKITVLRPK